MPNLLRKLIVASIFFLPLIYIRPLWAEPVLFGISDTGVLLQIHPITGSVETIGDPDDSYLPGGLAFRESDDSLYSIEAAGSNRLFKINRETGEAELIGGISGFPGPIGFGFPGITGLTFGPNDQLYGTIVTAPNAGSFTIDAFFRISDSLEYQAIISGSGTSGFKNGVSYDPASSLVYLSESGRQITASDPVLDANSNIIELENTVGITPDFGNPPGMITYNEANSSIYGVSGPIGPQDLVIVDADTGQSSSIPLDVPFRIVGLTFADIEDDPFEIAAPGDNRLVLFEASTTKTPLEVIRSRPSIVLTHGWQSTEAYQPPPPIPPCDALPCPPEPPVPTLDTVWTGAGPGQAATLIADVFVRNPEVSVDDVNIFQFVWKDAFTLGESEIPGLLNQYEFSASRVNNAGIFLAAKLHDVLGIEYNQPVHFVGHSLGSIVSAIGLRTYLANSPNVLTAQFTALDRPDPEKVCILLFCSEELLEDILFFDKDFFWSQLESPYYEIDLRLENYFSASSSLGPSTQGLGSRAEPDNVIYNHVPSPTNGLDDPGNIPAFAVLGGRSDSFSHHSGVHEWYRWTTTEAVESAGNAAGCEEHFGQIAGLFLLDESLNPCASGWQWAINNPSASQEFPLEKQIPQTTFRVIVPEITLVEEQGCTVLGNDINQSTIQCLEQSSPYLVAEIDVPEGAQYLQFEYLFQEPGDGDFATIFLNETPIWSLVGMGSGATESFSQSGPIPLVGLSGPQELRIKLFGTNEPNADFLIRDIRVLSPQDVDTVDIDILPGSRKNCVRINGRGVIPVSLHGSPEVDVRQIDPLSLRLNGLEVRKSRRGRISCRFRDRNRDGFLDLNCSFDDDLEKWQAGNNRVALLTGSLFDGLPINGGDSICLLPNRRRT